MSKQVVALNQEDVSVRIRVLDDATGVPYTSMTAATTGHEIWYQRGFDLAAVTDSGSAADHSGIGDAHTDWEFIHIKDGWYRVDVPDAAFAEGVGSVLVGMSGTGYTGITVEVVVEPLFKFQGTADSATSTTTTFPAGTDPYKGDYIYCVDGTGIKQTVLITSVSGQVATHEAWPDVNISSTTSTILLIAGEGGAVADAVVNSDAAISGLPTSSDVAAVQATADSIETDTQDIQSRLPSALTSNGNLNANVEEINEATVIGAGTAGDLWRNT